MEITRKQFELLPIELFDRITNIYSLKSNLNIFMTIFKDIQQLFFQSKG